MLPFTRANSLLATAVVVLAVSFSCGKQAAELTGTVTAKALPPGITQNLTRSDLTPLCFLDNIGPVSDPAKQKSVQVSGDTPFGITGWAVDDAKKVTAGGVDVVIDQVPFSAHYGSERVDVATHFKQPEYQKSGFELTIAPGQLAKGQHSVSIRVISSDKKSYYQGPVVQFAVS
jgi:hypothetical protein